jgi:predicted nucleotidyltransferase
MSRIDQGSRHGVAWPTDRLIEFCRRWKIRRLDVFGSYLRDDFGPDSDIDLLYDFQPGARWNLFHLVTMREELASIVGRRVDLVGRETIESSPNYLLRRQILSTAEPMYAEG